MVKRTFTVELWVENEIDARDVTDAMYQIPDNVIDSIVGDLVQYKIISRDEGNNFNLGGSRFQEKVE